MATKKLVTAALPYVNNEPHLGNLIGCVLSADVYARYCRSRGYDTLFICGSDEYGTATEHKAKEENTTPQEICQRYHALHQAIYQNFNISFDYYGQTSTESQTSITHEVYQNLWKAGLLEPRTIEQYYCTMCQTFLADRFIRGECPKCHDPKAKGDECDICNHKLTSPTELINPYCGTKGGETHTLEYRTTEHLFLLLSKMSQAIEEYNKDTISTITDTPTSSENVISVTNAWLADGLHDRCITRDLSWGTPIPIFNSEEHPTNLSISHETYKDKVFYVWADAVLGYISITMEHFKKQGTPDKWKEWWLSNPQSNPQTELIQFIGKDNIPFHSIIFPALLMHQLPHTSYILPTAISSTEYLTYEGGKFSKSENRGVFARDINDYPYPVDTWRMYLISCRPERRDTNFSMSDMQSFHNNVLIANLGNLVNRVTTLSYKYAQITELPVESSTNRLYETDFWDEHSLKDTVKLLTSLVNQYMNAMSHRHMKEATQIYFEISRVGNNFIQKHEPWKYLKTLQVRTANTPTSPSDSHQKTIEEAEQILPCILIFGINVVYLLAELGKPFMPTTSNTIIETLDVPDEVSLKFTMDMNYQTIHEDIIIDSESNSTVTHDIPFQLWIRKCTITKKPKLLFTPVR